MKNKSITVHTMVKNEEQWIWYALKSVLDYADQILVFDTGSTDKTVKIIKSIKSTKIIFEQKGEADAVRLRILRQEQLERTKTDWFLIVDGDEVWPLETLAELKYKINQASTTDYGVVVRAWNLIGDLYHFHPESEDYQWPYAPLEFKGWMNLRAINRKIPGLHLRGIYPMEAYCDAKNIPLQNYGLKKLQFCQNRYFHMTYLCRSSLTLHRQKELRRGINKIPEIGRKLNKNITFPQVFYLNRPAIVPDCWLKQTTKEKFRSIIFTPVKIIKRRIFKY